MNYKQYKFFPLLFVQISISFALKSVQQLEASQTVRQALQLTITGSMTGMKLIPIDVCRSQRKPILSEDMKVMKRLPHFILGKFEISIPFKI